MVTISFDVEMEQGNILNVYDTNLNYDFILGMNTFENIGNKKQRINFTKKLKKPNKESDRWILDFYNKGDTDDKYTISNIKIEKGTIATDWTPAPEDLQNEIVAKSTEISTAQSQVAQARAEAYADNRITDEERARIEQADANLELVQQRQKTLKDELISYADDIVNSEERARIEADKAKELELQAKVELAEKEAKAYADGIVTDEENRAIQDAKKKFEEAKRHAEEKAEQAQSLANEYAKEAQENAQAYADDKVNGLNFENRNLLLGTLNYDYGFENKLDSRLEKINDKLWLEVYNDWLIQQTINTCLLYTSDAADE